MEPALPSAATRRPRPDDEADTVADPPPDLRADAPVPAPQRRAAGPATKKAGRGDRGSSKGADAARDLPTTGHIGRYALKYHIGSGGLGEVMAAHDPLLSRLVAIKTLKVDAANRESFESRFLNEARAAAGLSHPNIVTVFDAGLSDQGPYIAMELLKGRDLHQLREEGWRPTPEQAATIVRRVADALAYAHAKGVVHRDIKPANILMVGRTMPKVLDFGIASVATGRPAAAKDDGSIAGSPFYMAPEQVRGEAVDQRVDVFALGVVFYELLCGQKPFRGRTLAEIQHAVLNLVPPPPHELDRSVPSALSAIVVRSIEKNRDRRYRSAQRLARHLRQWLEEHAQQDEPIDEGPTAAERAGEAVAGLMARWPRPVVGAGLLALAVGGWWAGRISVPSVPAAAPVAAVAPEPPAEANRLGTPVAPRPRPVRREVPPPPMEPAAPVAAPEPEAAPPRAAERRARPAPAAVAPQPVPILAPPPTGTVRLAISPWGEVAVDGLPVGIAPPLSQLDLEAGLHTITLRNSDLPPHEVTIDVEAGQTTTLRHRF